MAVMVAAGVGVVLANRGHGSSGNGANSSAESPGGVGGSGSTALAQSSAYHPSGRGISVGAVAPGFRLKADTGRAYSLAGARGKVVLLEFLAVWCPHCQAQASVLNRLESVEKPAEFEMLSVVASPYSKAYMTGDLSPYTEQDVHWFVNTYHVAEPVLVDPMFRVTNAYLLPKYPTMYLIDKQGRVRYRFSGDVSESVLQRDIRTLE